MAISTTSATVTTSAAAISTDTAGPSTVIVAPQSGTIYVGGSGVTTANGLPVAAGAVLTLTTRDPLYAIAGSSTSVRVLQDNV